MAGTLQIISLNGYVVHQFKPKQKPLDSESRCPDREVFSFIQRGMILQVLIVTH